MLNKKPRIPTAVTIPENLGFLQGFRDYLIAQTVSPPYKKCLFIRLNSM